ncbi:MAG: TfoX/Sxy family protein [Burkholderiaceae bacterium]
MGGPSDESRSVARMRGLGAASARMLRAAGIDTQARLRELGAVAAFAQVRAAGCAPSLNLLWALEGALTDQAWQQVARESRVSLLLALETYERQHAPPSSAG